MSNRLDKEREARLQPKRVEYAIKKIRECGIETTLSDDTKIQFLFKGEKVTLFPYSGWHSGKSIKDGRGLEKLLEQLKNKKQ